MKSGLYWASLAFASYGLVGCGFLEDKERWDRSPKNNDTSEETVVTDRAEEGCLGVQPECSEETALEDLDNHEDLPVSADVSEELEEPSDEPQPHPQPVSQPIDNMLTDPLTDPQDPPAASRGDVVENTSKIRSMAILGDSLGTGVLSNTQLGAITHLVASSDGMALGDREKDNPVQDALFTYGAEQVTWTEVLMGEYPDPSRILAGSMPAVTKASVTHLANPFSNALANGGIEAQFSHQSRLGIARESILNLAQAGASVENLGAVIREHREALSQVDYVVVTTGLVETCQLQFQDDAFVTALQNVLKQLTEKSRPPLVLLVPPLRVGDIFEALPDEVEARHLSLEVRSFLGEYHRMGAVSCGNLRSLEPEVALCPAYRAEGVSLHERHKRVIEAMKRALQGLMPEIRESIVFAEEVGAPQLMDVSAIAGDCFHPNTEGLKRIADVTWAAVRRKLD